MASDRLHLLLARPDVVRDAFQPGTMIVTCEQLEAEAGLEWLPQWGSRRLSPALEWQAQMRRAITDELRRLAREQPRLPFDEA